MRTHYERTHMTNALKFIAFIFALPFIMLALLMLVSVVCAMLLHTI